MLNLNIMVSVLISFFLRHGKIIKGQIDDAAFAQVLDRNFTEEERRGIRFFHFPGALDYKKMNFLQILIL